MDEEDFGGRSWRGAPRPQRRSSWAPNGDDEEGAAKEGPATDPAEADEGEEEAFAGDDAAEADETDDDEDDAEPAEDTEDTLHG